MLKAVHWGIMGTGAIARNFASDLAALPDARLFAVGSRSQAKADELGGDFNLTCRYSGYEDLVNDPEVEAIYLATPHSCHQDNTLPALAANKPVLAEKPFAISAHEAAAVIRVEREKGLLVPKRHWPLWVPPLRLPIDTWGAEGAVAEVATRVFVPASCWLNARHAIFICNEEDFHLVGGSSGGGCRGWLKGGLCPGKPA